MNISNSFFFLLKNINLRAHFLFLLLLCRIKIEWLLFLKFLKNLAFLDSYFWPFNKSEGKIKVIFVINTIMPSIWNVFIKFCWPGEKLTGVTSRTGAWASVSLPSILVQLYIECLRTCRVDQLTAIYSVSRQMGFIKIFFARSCLHGKLFGNDPHQLNFYIHHIPINRKVDILYFSLVCFLLCLAHWTFVN